MENLILAGAFGSFLPAGVRQRGDSHKRQLLWQFGLLEKKSPGELPLEFGDTKVSLPAFTELEEMKADYQVQGLSTKYHPMRVMRQGMSGDGSDFCRSSEIAWLLPNSRVRLAGYVITRQRPATAKGFAFMTLEDEEGMVNVVIKPCVYQKYRQVFKLEPLIIVEGTVQRRDENLNIIARKLTPLRGEHEKGGSTPYPNLALLTRTSLASFPLP